MSHHLWHDASLLIPTKAAPRLTGFHFSEVPFYIQLLNDAFSFEVLILGNDSHLGHSTNLLLFNRRHLLNVLKVYIKLRDSVSPCL